MSIRELGPVKGLVAASFAPLMPDGELNPDALPPYADFLVKEGVEGVFVNGTTGEGALLTMEERKRIVEGWVAAAEDKLKVIVHVGCGNVPDSVELARHAETVGARAVAVSAPTYFKPTSVNALVAFNEMVAASVPHLPFFYYHIPVRSGCVVPVDEFYARASRLIPNFRGMKFSSSDTVALGLCRPTLLRFPAHQVFWGCDEALPTALYYGLEAAIGSTFNFMAPVYGAIIAAHRRGDAEIVMDLLYSVQDFVKSLKTLSDGGFIEPVLKKCMTVVSGVEMGPVRLPLEDPTREQNEKLGEPLERLAAVIERARLIIVKYDKPSLSDGESDK